MAQTLGHWSTAYGRHHFFFGQHGYGDQVFVVHGEPDASDALRQKIERTLGWRTVVPEHGSTRPLLMELWPMEFFLVVASAIALKRYRQTLD